MQGRGNESNDETQDNYAIIQIINEEACRHGAHCSCSCRSKSFEAYSNGIKYASMYMVWHALKVAGKTLTRNAFCSKAYHVAKSIKKRAGGTPEEQQDAAR